MKFAIVHRDPYRWSAARRHNVDGDGRRSEDKEKEQEKGVSDRLYDGQVNARQFNACTMMRDMTV